ncbi:MAG: hypothetical protein HYW50_00430, partial [Candidatus Diapherotrites archaeon]|nr:hypothetical protein [Candidatus Diapherotrites archaeon]
IETFGKSKGLLLHNSSLGIGESQLEETRERLQISRISTLKKDSRDFEEIFPTVLEQCSKVFEKVCEEKKFFKTVGLNLITADLKTLTKSRTLENFTDNVAELKNTAKHLLESFLAQNPQAMLRRIGVRATNFSKKATEKKLQKTLAEF